MSEYIYPLGDSTLDNLFWVKNKKDSVEGKLRNKGYRVISQAFDGFTTHSVLNGDVIGSVLPSGSKKADYLKEKGGAKYISPLKELQREVSNNQKSCFSFSHPVHHIVISVGGNDFRVNLHRPWKLVKDIPQIQKRYLEILEKVKNLKGLNIKPLLLFQYRTDANHDPYLIYNVLEVLGTVAVATHLTCYSLLTAPLWVLAGQVSGTIGATLSLAGGLGLYSSKKIVPLSVTKNVLLGKKIGMSMIGGMLESFYKPILEQAKKDRIPILDLPNTFNPYENLYECGIEPNEKGSDLIAEGIDHIIRHHDYTKEGMLYSKNQGSFKGVVNKNPSDWKVLYPSHPQPS